MRAVRPKPIETEPTDNWIWGNNRGGGGAPLKDAAGTPLANLRDVVRGNVQPDHSPNRSPIHARKYSDYDSERRVQSPVAIKGLEQHYNNKAANQRNRMPDAYENPIDYEKEQKLKRNLEYQDALKQQIEEKERRKAMAKKNEDELKRREYDELTTGQNKGKGGRGRMNSDENNHNKISRDRLSPPPQQRNRKRSDSDASDTIPPKGYNRNNEEEDDYNHEFNDRHGKAQRNSRKAHNPDNDHHHHPPPSLSHPSHNHHARNNRNEIKKVRHESYDDEDEGNEYSHNRKTHLSPSKNRREPEPKFNRNDYVSREEYEHLEFMYDNLSKEHEVLQDELRSQAALIEELQIDNKHKAPKESLKITTNKKDRLDSGKKNVAFGRPVKSHTPKGGNDTKQGIKQPSANRRPNSMSTIERKRDASDDHHMDKLPNIKPVIPNGRKVPKLTNENNKPFAEPSEGNKRGGGGGGGMMSLLNRDNGGPVRVAYDAEDGVNTRAARLHSPVTVSRGDELNGESEHLSLRPSDNDVISDNQLKRLLLQARDARAAPSERPRPNVHTENKKSTRHTSEKNKR
jgi:hypothetical protein